MKSFTRLAPCIVVCALLLGACDSNSSDSNAPVRVLISPRNVTLVQGERLQMTARIIDGDGRDTGGTASWSSSNTTVVEINAEGMLTAVGPGVISIQARAESLTDATTITVREAPGASSCGPFDSWELSPFHVPYPEGTSYTLNQGNCSGFGHSGFWKHGYDFIMPIGTSIAAARSGSVLFTNETCTDGNSACTNLITVDHGDGTVALYSHLTTDGALVSAGDTVEQGQVIALSGNTGLTGGLPHLHFSVHPCGQLPGLPGSGNCPSIPANFSNTNPNPEGPQRGLSWPAISDG